MYSQLKSSYLIRALYRPLIAGTTTLVLMFSIVTPPAAVAQPPGLPMHPGLHMNHMPLGHEIVYVGAAMFFFLNGVFYKRAPEGYVVSPAPIGARIPKIPAEVVPLTVNGTLYYTCKGIYYQKLPGGYVVVPRPVEPYTSVAVKGEQLLVTVAILNVRSGPGLEYPVIRQISENQVLDVQSSGSDWAYVKLPDTTNGWVKIKYTSNVGRPVPMG